jgi:hypothetical protein
MIDSAQIHQILQKKVGELIEDIRFQLESSLLSEVKMKRVIRGGKVVKKVAVKKKGFKIKRVGNKVMFVREKPSEKRKRAKAMKKAWKKGKSKRLNKTKKSMKKTRRKMKAMKSLYRK